MSAPVSIEMYDELLTTRVATAIARELDTSPMDLEPLYSVIDTDALDRLFRPGAIGTVTFEYCGHIVEVSQAGEVEISTAHD